MSRSQTLALPVLLCSLSVPRLVSQSAPASVETPIFDLQPGKTTKAEADLRLGEPLRKIEQPAGAEFQAYEYAPPREAPEAERVAVSYFTDSWQVARVDIHLKAPMPADALREQFGTRIIARPRDAGGREELYYPRLQGLLFATGAADAGVTGVSYLSRRWLADYYVERFHEHLRAKRLDEARVTADKAVIVAPEYARGYVAQGTCFWQMSDYAEAKVRFLAGLNAASSPGARAVAHTWLGRWYLEQAGQVREAEAEYRKAVEEAPLLADAHLGYGRFLVSQKRPAEAITELKKAVELAPANMQPRRILADVLHDQRRYNEEYPHLEALFRWAEAGGSSDAKLRAAILRRYAEALWPVRSQGERRAFGKPEQALEIYERAAQVDPEDPWAFVSIGEIYRDLGEPAKAVQSYRSGLQRDSKLFELQRGLGMALLDSGAYAQARQVAESAVLLNPKFAAAQMVQVARAWCALRDKKRALLWLQKAVDGGYNDRQYLTSDRYLAAVRDSGDFKKILQRMP